MKKNKPIITGQLKKWKGGFGKVYTERNAISVSGMDRMYKGRYGATRSGLNKIFLDKIDRSARILEVGSNVGNQLLCLQKMGFKRLYGIEPQDYAVELSKKRTKGISIIRGNIFDIPFKDDYFDIIFTSGVLIHINPKDINRAIKEIHRCSRVYIWGFEYYSKRYEEVLYRGHKDLLWKANFSGIYKEIFPGLKVVKISFLEHLDNSGNTDAMFLLKKRIRKK
ncbi:pseudaminic acid biosynthesis-associated methylase [Candidatus Omnitrophota bacterium]